MRIKIIKIAGILAISTLVACTSNKDPNATDPYEKINRKTYKFNEALDATLYKPVAKVYKAILPPQARLGIRNFSNNLQMVPTVVNDILQGKLVVAYLDSWRLLINTTVGIGGVFDVAEKWGLPYKSNDLGLTLARWGDKHSPYFVVPFFGPSTFRDAAGASFDYSLFSVYARIKPRSTQYGLLALSLIQFRSDLLDSDDLIDEALDEYTLVRDAYLQNRAAKIHGKAITSEEMAGELYIEGEEEESIDGADDGALYVEDDDEEEPSDEPQQSVEKPSNTENSESTESSSSDPQSKKEN